VLALAFTRVNVGKKATGTRKLRRFLGTEHEANEFIGSLQDTVPRKGDAGLLYP
jgi:hypothetical protein